MTLDDLSRRVQHSVTAMSTSVSAALSAHDSYVTHAASPKVHDASVEKIHAPDTILHNTAGSSIHGGAARHSSVNSLTKPLVFRIRIVI